MKMSNVLPFTRNATLPLLAAAALCAQQPQATEITMQWMLRQPDGKGGVKKDELTTKSQPGPGKDLRVFVAADRECVVSFAGFTRDSQLAYGVPEIVTLKANVTKELPASRKW